MHGVDRAAISKAQGGRWSTGFWSGVASDLFNPGTKMGGDGAGGFTLRTSIAAIIGGTVSQTTGGKFANGAVSGTFTHMFNAEGINKKIENFVNRVHRAIDYSEVYYDSTMDLLTVLGKNVGEKASGIAVVAYKNSKLAKNIFYKKQYGLKNVLFSKSSVPLAERILTKAIAPVAAGTITFKIGVGIGSGIKGFYYEFGRN